VFNGPAFKVVMGFFHIESRGVFISFRKERPGSQKWGWIQRWLFGTLKSCILSIDLVRVSVFEVPFSLL
jgi:hypothetical protein